MHAQLSAPPARDTLRVLVPLFLVSGATGLVYETIWSRHLHLVFGTSQLAISTVLAAFMAGLALGGFLAARLVGRARHPLRVYAALEAGIGLYALVFPFLVSAVEPVYTAFNASFSPSPLQFSAFQFAILGVMLLPPTMCMGGTLPLLARYATRQGEEAGRSVGRLYGANTLGAVVGTWLAGFILLPELGLNITTAMAAAANLILAVGAWTLSRGEQPLPDEVRDAEAVNALSEAPLWVLAALAGFSSLLYEVAWFRVLLLTLGGSAYAFTTMLLAFLMGIGLGGLVGGPIADKALSAGGQRAVLLRLAAVQCGIGLLAWGAMYLYGELPFAYVLVFDAVADTPELLWPAMVCLSLLVMLPPTLLMGAAFPLLVRAAVPAGAPETGGPVGRIYGANTLGAIFGAALGGFLLLPALKVTGSVLLGIGVNMTGAALAWVLATRGEALGRRVAGLAVALVLVIVGRVWPPHWDPMLMTAGVYKYVSEFSDHSREGLMNFAVRPYELLFYEEGLSSVVTVAKSKESGNIWLANNGKVDASTSIDMPTQVLVSDLGFAFAPDAKDVMVIGLASGITAGSVTRHKAPERIDLVELEPAVVRASRFFEPLNGLPLQDPRLHLYTNDGRNQVLLAKEGSYDLVVSEPSNPWQSGVSNLFTAEFFKLGKARLKRGGVWAQWVQMYGMGYDDLLSLIRTFSESFAYARLFSTIEDADLVLIGSDDPLPLDEARFDAMIHESEGVSINLAGVGVYSAADILSFHQLDRDELLARSAGVALNTDDNMRIEYSAPRHLHEDTSEDNFRRLLRPGKRAPPVPLEAAPDLADKIDLAEAYARREDWVRALITLRAANEQVPDDPTVQLRYTEYLAKLTAHINGEDDD